MEPDLPGKMVRVPLEKIRIIDWQPTFGPMPLIKSKGMQAVRVASGLAKKYLALANSAGSKAKQRQFMAKHRRYHNRWLRVRKAYFATLFGDTERIMRALAKKLEPIPRTSCLGHFVFTTPIGKPFDIIDRETKEETGHPHCIKGISDE